MKVILNKCYSGFSLFPLRKTVGNADKLISTFKKYVDRLYDIVNQQIAEGNIHNNFQDIVNVKI